jgi:hypothetical protein
MNDRFAIWPFVLSALAIWRLTHLVAKEDGPWDLIVRLRSWFGAGFFGRLMDCFYCLSLWFAFPFAVWITRVWVPMLINWLALSGAACLLEQSSSRQGSSFPHVEFAPELPPGDTSCVAVKNETR